MNETESGIVKFIKGCEKRGFRQWPDASEISDKIGLSYDTTSEYLKKMTKEGILCRNAVGCGNPNNKWSYRYHIK
jgi:predicted transcriptional regulator